MDMLFEFLRFYPVRRFGKGEVILQQEEIPEHGYVVKNGIVKTYNLTSNGEEKPITFKLKNDVFPISWLFSKTDQTQYYYEALCDCELYLVPPEDYLQFLKNNPKLLFSVFQSILDHNLEYQMRINALEQSKAKDKVLLTLQYLVQRFGNYKDRSWVEIQLPFTQQDMANFMGLSRETAAIELKKLEREGVISYQHRTYLIETAHLKQLLGRDYAASYEFKSFKRAAISVKLIDKYRNAYAKTYK